MSKEELIQQAVAAHEAYVRGVEELRLERQRAFRQALAGPVSARELSERVGLSGSIVTRISKGQR